MDGISSEFLSMHEVKIFETANTAYCGTYDRADVTTSSTTSVYNSTSGGYDSVTTYTTVPGFAAASLCCACGKPATDITEYQFDRD